MKNFITQRHVFYFIAGFCFLIGAACAIAVNQAFMAFFNGLIAGQFIARGIHSIPPSSIHHPSPRGHTHESWKRACMLIPICALLSLPLYASGTAMVTVSQCATVAPSSGDYYWITGNGSTENLIIVLWTSPANVRPKAYAHSVVMAGATPASVAAYLKKEGVKL
jgi:hypothetical protein